MFDDISLRVFIFSAGAVLFLSGAIQVLQVFF